MREEEDEKLIEDRRDEHGKRHANSAIVVNRGLTVNRRKDQKNAKIKLRKSYQKKTGAHHARMARQDERNNYQGERKIDPNLVRSKKFK